MNETAPLSVTEEHYHLGALCRIAVTSSRQEEARARTAVHKAFEEVERVEGLFDNFLDDKDDPDPSSLKEIRPLLTTMLALAKETNGRYDPTVRPLVELYGFYTPPGEEPNFHLPAPGEIKKTLKTIGYQEIGLSDTGLVFGQPDLELDFGSVGKGYALERALAVLRENGVKSALLDFGGNIAAMGDSPKGGPWRIGIQNPRGEGIVGVIPVKDKAVSTSGDYQRFFVENGVRYHHLLDAQTGYPARGLIAVIALHSSPFLADALSTAAFLAGPGRALPLIEEHGGEGILILAEEEQNGDERRLRVISSQSLDWEPFPPILFEPDK